MRILLSLALRQPLALLLTACFSLGGCTYTMAVSQTNIPVLRSKPVEVATERFIFLGFNFDNDYALQLSNKLKESCPQGDVRGVTTQDTVTLYLFYILWAREIKARGYCIPERNPA